jgi:protein ImuB
MVERVRWQLDGWIGLPKGSADEITSGVVLVRLVPDEVRRDEGQQLGLWGEQSDADRRAIRTLARLSTIAGEHAVTVPVWRGGRLPAERYRWVSAVTADLDARTVQVANAASVATEPWPGSLPSPSPATVLADPRPVEVVDAAGGRVVVSGRGVLSAPPAQLVALHGDDHSGWRRGVERRIVSWAGPWLIEERWWEPQRHRRQARFQIVTDDQRAHLVVAEQRRWWIAAQYD